MIPNAQHKYWKRQKDAVHEPVGHQPTNQGPLILHLPCPTFRTPHMGSQGESRGLDTTDMGNLGRPLGKSF